MNIKKFLFPALLVFTVLALIRRVFARPASAKPVTNSPAYDAIDAYVEGQMRRLNIPGVSFAIVEGDQIVHQRGFGRAHPGGEAPSPETPFFIGSLTKSFTALAVIQLVEAGKVELDAPIQRYLPWFGVADPQASAQMTVRHLLNQTSGFSQSDGIIPLANFDDSPDASAQQARALSTCKLARPVGSAFEYSNVNYNLLGLIVEAASGELYAAYIQNRIFDPLEMSHSYTSKATAKRDGLAVGHQHWFGIPIAVPDLPVPSGSLPSGQLISSAEDMAHYLIAHLNQGCYGEAQILSPEGIAELHRPAVEVTGMGVAFGEYGMGWMIEETSQGRRISHKGTVPNFFAYMALLPEQNRGVVLLVNANQLMIDFALAQVGSGVASLLAGIQPKPIPLSVVPWVQRGFLLIPALQIAGIATTLRLLRRWHRDQAFRPSVGRMWGQYILLPLIPNLSLAAIPLYLQVSGMLRSMLLFLPDFSWIALICGSISGIWAILRTGLILRTLRKPQESKTLVGQLGTEQGVLKSSDLRSS
jgi:CubicO group peptidase (beta-lactamase class C family)